MVIGLVAVNTGNNLLYLLLAWLLSLIVASGALSEMVLRGLEIRRRMPPTAFAGDPLTVDLFVTNLKSRVASYAIEITDLGAGGAIDKPCFFLKVAAKKTATARYHHAFCDRGPHTLSGFRIATRFPFGLFEKSRELLATTDILVYPAVSRIATPPPEGTARGLASSTQLSRRGEVHGLREHRPGDDRRDIHWKASARRGRLAVREYEAEGCRRVTIAIDNALPTPTTAHHRAALEVAIRHAASLSVAYLGAGYAVGLISRTTRIPMATGPLQRGRILAALALLAKTTASAPFAVPPLAAAEQVMVIPRIEVHPGSETVSP
ncbi:MAG TPA: DUF58 domain-containing protein [Kofleriaceae bacterium]|nr:DUF58 domain-containing protein [Kofleriaceae bacterium]